MQGIIPFVVQEGVLYLDFPLKFGLIIRIMRFRRIELESGHTFLDHTSHFDKILTQKYCNVVWKEYLFRYSVSELEFSYPVSQNYYKIIEVFKFTSPQKKLLSSNATTVPWLNKIGNIIK